MVALYVLETLEDEGTKKPTFSTLQDFWHLDVNVSDVIEKYYFVVSHFINTCYFCMKILYKNLFLYISSDLVFYDNAASKECSKSGK